MTKINEKILVNYDHEVLYNNTASNIIGANTSQTLRTIAASTDINTKHVKLFGTDYAIGDITNAVISTPRSDGGGTNQWKYEFYNENGTLLGYVTDANAASVFTDGTAEASTKIYIKVVWISGTVSITNGDDIALTTDVDSPLSVLLPGESFTSGTLLLSLSSSGSTYYMLNQSDFTYKYGGYRHTPDGTSKYPYFDIASAVATLGGAFTICEIMDSETYLIDAELDLNVASMILQSSLGKTPTILRTAGQTPYYFNDALNNSNTIYFNENGDDANAGTWQNPKETISGAIAAGAQIAYGGNGATDSGGVFEYSWTATKSLTVYSEYGYSPIWRGLAGGNIILINSSTYTVSLYNWKLVGNGGNIGFSVTSLTIASQNINRVSFSDFSAGFKDSVLTANARTYTFNDCIFENCGSGIYCIQNDTTAARKITATVNRSIFKNCTNAVLNEKDTDLSANQYHIDANIYNCYIYNCTNGLYYYDEGGSSVSEWYGNINFEKNTCFKNGRSIYCDSEWVTNQPTETIQNNIFSNNTVVAVDAGSDASLTINYNSFYDNTSDTSGTVVNNNPVTTDPKLCKNTGSISSYRLGIAGGSSCYRTGSDSDNIGARLRIAEINASTITINGLTFEGGEFYANALYILDTADHIGLILKWNTFQYLTGIAVDMYDDATNIAADIQLNKFNDVGAGLTITTGGNSITNNIFSYNDFQCIFLDDAGHTITNNVFYFGKYGLETATTASSITYQNNISLNFTTAIKTSISMSIFYSCITDGVSASVDKSSTTNINNNPLFVDTEIGSEDFNIKTIEAGFFRDSACKDAGSDGKDMGAYIVARSILSDSWASYQFDHNPRKILFEDKIKGVTNFEKLDGGMDLFGKDMKRGFTFQWAVRQVTSEEIRNKVSYFATRIKTRYNNIALDEKIKLRISFLPSQSLFSGTSGDVDSNARTLIDTSKSMIENQHKGYHVGIVYESGTNLVIDATAKTATDSSKTLVADQYEGYYIWHNNNFYYILSNTTGGVFTLSDPNNTLSNTTKSTYTIERYFKIESNTATRFCLNDDDNKLESILSTSYYIRFIECISTKPLISYTQPRYFWQEETWKQGFQLGLEEF
jgi:parallel beta-helix repeat protein